MKKKPFNLNKDNVERMIANAGLKPVKRDTYKGYDIFICDGFSAMPHTVFGRFGVEPGEFPWGCYCTMWWIARGEDHFDVGYPIFFEAMHDPQYDPPTKKQARVNTASKDAINFIKNRARQDAHGLPS